MHIRIKRADGKTEKTIWLEAKERRRLAESVEILTALSLEQDGVYPVVGMLRLLVDLIDDKGNFNPEGKALVWDDKPDE